MTDKELNRPQLPIRWAWAKFADVCNIDSGYAFKSKEYQKEGVPLVRISNLKDGYVDLNRDVVYVKKAFLGKFDAFKVEKGDILVALSGATTGKFGSYNSDTVSLLNQRVGRIVPNNSYIPRKYLLLYLGIVKQLILRKAYGAAQPNISTRELGEVDLPIAPLLEQIRIVAKVEELFSFLDAGVASLRKVQEQLKRYRQAVLKYAFEGKLTEEWRRTHKDQIEPASSLLKQINKKRQQIQRGYKKLPPIDQSTLPALPESWERERIGAIAEINPKPSNIYPDNLEVTFLPMKAVEEKTGRFDSTIIRKYSEVRKGYTFFQNGDVLFAKITPCMENGKIAAVDNLKNGVGFGSTEFHVIRPDLRDFPRNFFFYYFLQNAFRKDAQMNMTGSAGQLRVPVRYMENAVIPIPSLLEQQQIIEEIERFFIISEEVEKAVKGSLKHALKMRQSILKRAFEGKLVPQNPEDEPAERLLKRIKEEQAKHKINVKTNGKERIKQVGLMQYVE